MNRRTFLQATAAVTAATAQMPPIPIIDSHIHLFDPTRSQGIPWPPKTNTLIYKPTLPKRYRELTKSLGVVGAIEVECSPWLEDNQWVLDVCANETIMVGMIGNLEPGKPDFGKHLDRFRKNPLYRGIRCGNLWGRNLTEELKNPQVATDLKLLAAADLTMDSANPNQQLLEGLLRVTDLVPNLRIVIDHLPNMPTPKEKPALDAYQRVMREFAKRKQVWFKVSEVLHKTGDRVSYDLKDYKPKIDEMYDSFGPDRLIYGSDWPNSDPLGTYAQVLGVVKQYFAGKGRDVQEKYFWRNSVAAYKWVKREAGQPKVG